MNPFHAQHLIRASEEHYCLPALWQIFDKPFRHSDFAFSETQKASLCPFTGAECKNVKGVSLRGWISLWFR